MDPLASLILSFTLGFLGGALAGLGLRWVVGRRIYRLEIAVADQQRVILSMKGFEYATTRRKKVDQFQEELEALRALPKTERERYDNDPLVGGPG